MSHQRLPNGSRTRPTRSPHSMSVGWVTEVPPASIACRYVASTSSTYKRRNAGVAGQPGLLSNSITTESPIRTSACLDRALLADAPELDAVERADHVLDEADRALHDHERGDGAVAVGDVAGRSGRHRASRRRGVDPILGPVLTTSLGPNEDHSGPRYGLPYASWQRPQAGSSGCSRCSRTVASGRGRRSRNDSRSRAGTVRRDVERLRDLGYPVEATLGRVGGYRLVGGTAICRRSSSKTTRRWR